MKKLLSCLFITLFAVILVSSCGSAEAAEDEKVTIAFSAGALAEISPVGIGMAKFAEKAAEYSNGSIEILLYHDTQLGDATSQVQGVQQGSIDMVVTGAAYFTGTVPEIDVFQLPFIFEDYDHAHAAVDGEAGNIIKAKAEKVGFKMLGFFELGFRYLTNSVRPINSMADVSGLKLRTLPSRLQVAAWQMYGALPTAIDFAELYQSLQTGVVVGQENPIAEIFNNGFHEIQPYLTLTKHVYTPGPVVMSMTTWESLSPNQQDAVMRAIADGTEACRASTADIEKVDLEKMAAAGVKIVTDPDLSAFRETSQKVWQMFIDDYGDELIEKIKQIKRDS